MQAIKRFRTREILGLVNHLKHFGPLPEPSNSNTTTNQPTILQLPNPFLPKFNPKSGKWHKPNYSLRRQAELVKKAHATGTMHLLPPGPKKAAFETRMQRVAAATATATATAKPAPPSPIAPTGRDGQWDVPVEWVGKVPEKKVVGAELGIRLYAGKKRMFRGHLWERVRAKRIRRRTILMRDMAARVENYKTVRVFLISFTAFVNFHPSTTRRGNQTRSNRQDIQSPPSYHSKVNLHWLYLRSVHHHEPSNQLKSSRRATKTFI